MDHGSRWAFGAVGVTFLILGFRETTYLAIGIMFLVLAAVQREDESGGDAADQTGPPPTDEG